MSKYDKQIAISHEEEGTYHRREVEPTYTSGKPVTTYHTERYLVEDEHTGKSSRHAPNKSSSLIKSGNYTSDEDDKDNYEEWTTSKRKVNHKTRQVETRVSRQLLVENGKVIADSGPQVTTRIKEDNKVEECEKEKTPKNKSKFEALEAAPEGPEGSVHGRVLGEKKEIQRVSREVREENMQYHDERFKELTGRDVHQKAIRSPHELITINDKHHAPESAPRGKMVHYSNRGKKYQDTDEILEVAKLAIDGSVTKEVKRTHNHEEFSEDELPDEKGEAEKLRHEPVVQRSSRRHVDYVNDYDDTRTPEASDNDEREEYDSRGPGTGAVRKHKHKPLTSEGRRTSAGPRQRHHDSSDEAFPRYDLDPLLNSLRDEDYKPAAASAGNHQRSGRVKELPLRRPARTNDDGVSSSVSSSDAEFQRGRGSRASTHAQRQASGHRSPAGNSMASGGRVEIPEVYRKNKERLLAGKSSSRERSYSPQHQRLVHTSNVSSSRRRDDRNQSARAREDAATQAHLTDEEIDRHSIGSSLSGAGAGQHARTAKHLQRQSTPNASRRYYYGNAAVANEKAHQQSQQQQQRHRNNTTTEVKRRGSFTSSASSVSSIEDAKARARQQGVRSRDSGFRSPHERQRELESPEHKSQQIYSISSKSAKSDRGRRTGGATSPTPSAGQRSVKTTTTTVSAGLADRPESRASRAGGRTSRNSPDKVTHKNVDWRKFAQANGHPSNTHSESELYEDEFEPTARVDNTTRSQRKEKSLDTISVSSLKSPSATKIKVPYRHVIEIQQETPRLESGAVRQSRPRTARAAEKVQDVTHGSVSAIVVEKSSSEMSLQEDIESLSKRLANISQQRHPGTTTTIGDQERRHFDYKTIVARVQAVPPHAQQNHRVDAYNVRTLEQNSPFQQQTSTIGESNNQAASGQPQHQQLSDNNNETNFNLSDYYVKYRATPALVDESSLLTVGKRPSSGPNVAEDEDDRMSQLSSKTYNIRTIVSTSQPEANQNSGVESSRHQDENTIDDEPSEAISAEFDENGNSKKPAAWIFDPRDGSSTAIVPPARPKRPEAPKVNSKTEELVQARGGRSYYLELVEPGEKAAKRQRPSSMDSLYSRWNSQGALNTSNLSYRPLAAIQPTRASQVQYKSTKQINSAIAQQQQDRIKAHNGDNTQRRQLPFSGPPSSLGNKSKSSSCLLNVTKPSKYSIYGGFRRPGETNKPVPRLSYSRAIGPRSQRIDGQPKPMPSRYLKMR